MTPHQEPPIEPTGEPVTGGGPRTDPVGRTGVVDPEGHPERSPGAEDPTAEHGLPRPEVTTVPGVDVGAGSAAGLGHVPGENEDLERGGFAGHLIGALLLVVAGTVAAAGTLPGLRTLFGDGLVSMGDGALVGAVGAVIGAVVVIHRHRL